MNVRLAGVAFFWAAMAAGTASAQDDDLAAGEALYASQCKVCHGLVAAPPAGNLGPGPSQWRAVRMAMQQSPGRTMQDVATGITAGAEVATATSLSAGEDPLRLAVAPPYGPNLRGIYGRPAGMIQGFVYSKAFEKSLKGMEWNDAALDVWITNPQKWVPGVYMFYKQPDAEVRRKIILYLKAN